MQQSPTEDLTDPEGWKERAKVQKTCQIEGCDKPFEGHGFCIKHLRRWQRHGDPTVVKLIFDEDERFWAKIDKTPDCWLWRGCSSWGYGQFKVGGKTLSAHRYSYGKLVGLIPRGYEIDHLCYVRACVNPDHLEAVTGAENRRRAIRRRFG